MPEDVTLKRWSPSLRKHWNRKLHTTKMTSTNPHAILRAVMKIDPAKTTSEILQDEEVVFVFVHLTVDHHALVSIQIQSRIEDQYHI